jgi:hypothetical protein
MAHRGFVVYPMVMVLLATFSTLLTGCAPKSRDLENYEVSAKPVEIAETNYVKSPNGKHAITESKEQYHVLLYKDIDKGEPKSIEIVGMNYRFLWSPDSSKVCVSYSGRIWSDFSIINVDRENNRKSKYRQYY